MPIVRLLVEKGAHVNAPDRLGTTPMREAVREGRPEVSRWLREHGGELGYDEQAASSELCELAKRGSLDMLKILLDCGCSVKYNYRVPRLNLGVAT